MNIIKYKYTRIDGKFNSEVIEPAWYVAILRKIVVFLFKIWNYQHFKKGNDFRDIITIRGFRKCLVENKYGTRYGCAFLHKIGKYHI